MGPSRLSWLAYGLASALLGQVASATQATQLEPIDILGNAPGRLVVRDNDYTKLDLLSTETFLWGGLSGKGKYALGNFTAYMPGKHENIIAMEKFYPWLKSTECTKDSLTMHFEDEEAYRYGAKAWKWVNDAEDHTFVLVAGRGHCQWNEDRLPFTITDVEFDDCANTIKAIGKATDWPKATHTYELFVGGRPASKKRDYDDSYSFDISQELPLNKAAFTYDGVQLEYTCDGCGTSGEFEFAFHMKTEYMIPVDVELAVSPREVEAKFEPQLKLSAQMGKVEMERSLGSIPIAGVSIAGGILDLGPRIEFSLATEIELKGSAAISGGGTASLEDSAQLTLDLLDAGVASSGWSPQFTPKPLTFDAALEGSLKVGLKTSVGLEVSALSKTTFDMVS
ncbi:hypothetical protein N7532_007236 [Penicillium argentinense]|uniref:Uncharacterized protein n=1 Tax=Penicillium argentinense TaxID=1131581 RepID=A0A9W9F7J4_9EURO|nr:uncharacterized protein N7532_007236 [Penicillium argentinense]KAJ5094945.1 hypothetical protein N7532_007236 [Penicillium argentinense]